MELVKYSHLIRRRGVRVGKVIEELCYVERDVCRTEENTNVTIATSNLYTDMKDEKGRKEGGKEEGNEDGREVGKKEEKAEEKKEKKEEKEKRRKRRRKGRRKRRRKCGRKEK